MSLALLLLAVTAWGQVSTDTTLAAHPANAFFLTSMNAFNGSTTPSGTGALNLALSPDGINFSQPVYMYQPTAGICDGTAGSGVGYCVRDTRLGRFANNGWIFYTCAYQAGANDTAQWCLTKIDLAACFASISTCSFAATVNVSTSSFSATLRDWGPAPVLNADNTVYLDGSGCPHIIYTSTDGSTLFQIAEMHPTGTCTSATNFGSATWSTPVVLTHMDTNMIGGTIIYDGTTFTLFYTNNTVSNQSIQYGTSSTLTGTYTKQSSGVNWTGFQSGGDIDQEGPAPFCVTYSGSFPSGSCTRWRLYFDQVNGSVGNLVLGQINYSESTAGFGGPWSAPTAINTTTQAKNAGVTPAP